MFRKPVLHQRLNVKVTWEEPKNRKDDQSTTVSTFETAGQSFSMTAGAAKCMPVETNEELKDRKTMTRLPPINSVTWYIYCGRMTSYNCGKACL